MWVNSNLSVLANTHAVLYPTYSSSGHRLSFATAKQWEVVSAAKFACEIKNQNIYFSLVNAVEGNLNYIYCSAYSG